MMAVAVAVVKMMQALAETVLEAEVTSKRMVNEAIVAVAAAAAMQKTSVLFIIYLLCVFINSSYAPEPWSNCSRYEECYCIKC